VFPKAALDDHRSTMVDIFFQDFVADPFLLPFGESEETSGTSELDDRNTKSGIPLSILTVNSRRTIAARLPPFRFRFCTAAVENNARTGRAAISTLNPLRTIGFH